MNGWRPVWLVARREIRERGRGRAYVISTIITVIAVVAFIVIPALLTGDEATTYDLGVTGEASAAMLEVIQSLAAGSDAEVEVTAYPSREAGVAALRREEVEAVLVDGEELIVESTGDGFFGPGATGGLEGLVQTAALTSRLEPAAAELGLTVDELIGLFSTNQVEVTGLEDSEDRGDVQGLAYFGLLLLYFAIITYGTWNLTGVTEEKTNRVVELLMAALRPHQILAGKVLGIGLLGVAQFVVVLAAAYVAVRFTGVFDLPRATVGAALTMVMWFVLGYAFYSVANAAIGATVSRMEEVQAVATPITLVVVASFFVAISTLDDPDGTLAVVASFVPPTAPFSMPIRMVLGAAATWEVAVSVVLMLVSIALLIRLGGRIYAGSLLQVGRRVRLGEAWRGADEVG